MGSTARELLDRLPGELRVGRAGLRVFAHFDDGHLHPPVKVAVFRVPANEAHMIDAWPRGPLELDVLEPAAAALGLTHGRCELVIEYAATPDGPRLHWIDFSWEE